MVVVDLSVVIWFNYLPYKLRYSMKSKKSFTNTWCSLIHSLPYSSDINIITPGEINNSFSSDSVSDIIQLDGNDSLVSSTSDNNDDNSQSKNPSVLLRPT